MLSFSSLSQFQAVVFDLDGTLVDSEGLYCEACIHAMATFGGSLTRKEYHLRIAGRSEDLIDEVMHSDLDGCAERSEIRTTRFDEFARLRDLRGVPVLPGVLDLLDRFDHHGLPMGVASAAEMRDIEENLRIAGIRDRFQVIASADEVPETKPAPDVYLLAAQRLGVPPEQCVAFEDTNSGARAAITAGMKTYMVPHHCEPDDFVEKHAQGIATSLTEVVTALVHHSGS